AVYGRAPALLEQMEHRRDEGAGMPDPDPPNEVDDAERPGDGDVVSPNADSGPHGVGDRREQDERSREREREGELPAVAAVRPRAREQPIAELPIRRRAENEGRCRHQVASSSFSLTIFAR